jgi:hypothetical protein
MIVFENFGFFAGGWEEIRGDEVVDGFVAAAFLDWPGRGELFVWCCRSRLPPSMTWNGSRIDSELKTQNSSKRKERRTGRKPPRINLSFLGSPFFKVVISFLADVSLLGDMISVSLVACRAFHVLHSKM